MSASEFSQASKVSDLYDLLTIYPDYELNSSSIMTSRSVKAHRWQSMLIVDLRSFQIHEFLLSSVRDLMA